MMLKKAYYLLGVFLLSFVLVIGCGGQEKKDTDAVTEAEGQQEEEAGTQQEETSDTDTDDGSDPEDIKEGMTEETSEEESEENIDETLDDADEEEPYDDTWLVSWRDDHPKVKGIYVTGSTAGSSAMDDLIELIDETELNAVVIDLKNDEGEITVTTEEKRSYINDVETIMDKLKEHDIYTIARIVCFKDPAFAEKEPEHALMKADGTNVCDGAGNAWVNPCDEAVWDHIATAAELAGDLGFEEIQFDYVRFPVGTDAEQAVYGIELNEETKKETITKFINYMTERLHKKKLIVGADLFGTVIRSEVDSKNVGQNFPAIISNIDVVSPMIYPSHYGPGAFGNDVPDANPYDTIYGALSETKEVEENTKAENEDGYTAVVRPWLQCFTASWVEGHISYDKPQIDRQIQAVYDAGYEEWILWNASNKYGSYKG